MAASAASAPLSSWRATAGVLATARGNHLLPLSLTSLPCPCRSGGVALLGQPRRLRCKGTATPFLVRSFSGQSIPPPAAAAGGPEMKSTLDQVVKSHKVVLFMKGTKDFPQCGFSNTVVQILKSLNVPFETFNILDNEMLRQGLKDYSNWPTFPQLYIDGEFFGGCDITVEAYKNGQLQELLEKAMCS